MPMLYTSPLHNGAVSRSPFSDLIQEKQEKQGEEKYRSPMMSKFEAPQWTTPSKAPAASPSEAVNTSSVRLNSVTDVRNFISSFAKNMEVPLDKEELAGLLKSFKRTSATSFLQLQREEYESRMPNDLELAQLLYLAKEELLNTLETDDMSTDNIEGAGEREIIVELQSTDEQQTKGILNFAPSKVSVSDGVSCVDGNGAVGHMAYGLSDVVFVFPLVEEGYLGQSLKTVTGQNAFGVSCLVEEMDTSVGASTALLGTLTQGSMASVLASSQSLVQMIPNMHLLSAQRQSCVFHVSASANPGANLGLTAGYDDVIAMASTGVALLHSQTVQEAHDLALVAHIAAFRSSLPFIHFFDGTRAAVEQMKTSLLPMEKLGKVAEHSLSRESVGSRAIVSRKAVADVVDEVMGSLRRVLKRRYRPFEYVGAADATSVVVAMCTQDQSTALSDTVAFLTSKHHKVGLLSVRLYRPWSVKHFMQALPSTVRHVAVFSNSQDRALFTDVAATIQREGANFRAVEARFAPDTTCNVSSAAVLFSLLSAPNPPPVLMLNAENVGESTLPTARVPIGEGTKAIIWDFVGSSSNVSMELAKGLADTTTVYTHAIQMVDNYTLSGTESRPVSSTHVSFNGLGSFRHIPSLEAEANIVVLKDLRILELFDVTAQLRDGGTLLLNIPVSETEPEALIAALEETLSESLIFAIVNKRIKLSLLDESGLLDTAGLDESHLGLIRALTLLKFCGVYTRTSTDKLLTDELFILGESLAEKYNLSSSQLVDTAKHVEASVVAVETPLHWVEVKPVETEIITPLAASQMSLDELTAALAAQKILPTRIVSPSIVRPRPAPAQLTGSGDHVVGSWHKAAWQLLFPEPHNATKVQRPNESDETFVIRVKKFERVTPLDYDRNVFHIEFDMSGTDCTYEIGDALGVYGHNDPVKIAEFLEWYGLDGQDTIMSAGQGGEHEEMRTVEQIFVQVLDLFGRPSRRFYAALLPFATNEEEREKLEFLGSPAGTIEFKKRVESTVTFAHLLREFESCHPTLEDLVELIPHIKPRHYSISSSMNMHPTEVHLLVVAVEWVDPSGELRTGQCTRYINALEPGDELTVCIKPSIMRLPKDPMAPVMMAGLGTGMAPFRAFIEERAFLKSKGIKVGPMALYFGSRYRAQEYLYGDELEAYESDGLLTFLRLAFSRDGPKKVYIQHLLKNDNTILYDFLNKKNGTFYLCGPTWPAPDVQEAIVNAYKDGGDVDKKTAEAQVKKLKQDERYILEVY